MSTTKISDLPALTAVDFDDEFVVVDDSAGVTKKATGVYQQGNILGTVSESSGTPTGSVIERGSNANGEYTKFADGTMIATAIPATYPTSDSAWGGLYRSTNNGATTLTWPVAFSAVPQVSASGARFDQLLYDWPADRTTTGSEARVFTETDDQQADGGAYFVFGRWY